MSEQSEYVSSRRAFHRLGLDSKNRITGNLKRLSARNRENADELEQEAVGLRKRADELDEEIALNEKFIRRVTEDGAGGGDD